MRNLKKILFLFFLFALFFSLFAFQFYFKNLVYLIFSPIQKFFWRTSTEISQIFFAILQRKEIEKIKIENLQLKGELERLKEIEKENEFLKRALELKKEDFEILPAKIVAKDIDQDFLLIDKGKKDGVFEGQVAISLGKSLLGRVKKVYLNFSKVELISNKGFVFNGKIPEKNLEVLVEGRGNQKVFLTLLPKKESIEVGQIVLTSSLGGKFPPNIFVGQIESIQNLDFKPYQEAKLKLPLSLSEIDSLLLIKNFFPWKED